MNINLSNIKKFLRKFWYIYAIEFGLLIATMMVLFHFGQVIKHIEKRTVYVQADGNLYRGALLYKSTKELMKNQQYKDDFIAYLNSEGEVDLLEEPNTWVEQNSEESFLYIVASSSSDEFSTYIADKTTDFLIYLSSKEGYEKYSYASFFKGAPLENRIYNKEHIIEKAYTFKSYIGGVALSFAVTAFTMCLCIVVNKKNFN